VVVLGGGPSCVTTMADLAVDDDIHGSSTGVAMSSDDGIHVGSTQARARLLRFPSIARRLAGTLRFPSR
jgi:hypothetical protein